MFPTSKSSRKRKIIIKIKKPTQDGRSSESPSRLTQGFNTDEHTGDASIEEVTPTKNKEEMEEEALNYLKNLSDDEELKEHERLSAGLLSVNTSPSKNHSKKQSREFQTIFSSHAGKLSDFYNTNYDTPRGSNSIELSYKAPNQSGLQPWPETKIVYTPRKSSMKEFKQYIYPVDVIPATKSKRPPGFMMPKKILANNNPASSDYSPSKTNLDTNSSHLATQQAEPTYIKDIKIIPLSNTKSEPALKKFSLKNQNYRPKTRSRPNHGVREGLTAYMKDSFEILEPDLLTHQNNHTSSLIRMAKSPVFEVSNKVTMNSTFQLEGNKIQKEQTIEARKFPKFIMENGERAKEKYDKYLTFNESRKTVQQDPTFKNPVLIVPQIITSNNDSRQILPVIMKTQTSSSEHPHLHNPFFDVLPNQDPRYLLPDEKPMNLMNVALNNKHILSPHSSFHPGKKSSNKIDIRDLLMFPVNSNSGQAKLSKSHSSKSIMSKHNQRFESRPTTTNQDGTKRNKLNKPKENLGFSSIIFLTEKPNEDNRSASVEKKYFSEISNNNPNIKELNRRASLGIQTKIVKAQSESKKINFNPHTPIF